jgi:Recombination endonuclease VII
MSPQRDPESQAAYLRQWKQDNPDKVAGYRRTERKKYAADPGPQQAANRRWKAANRERDRLYNKMLNHGRDIEAVIAAMWAAQDGRCYLCERPLTPGPDTVIDHDHTCCPRTKSCAYCRRGLACRKCNALVGSADDDPELLQVITSNLKTAVEATRARIATKPQQAALDGFDLPDVP